MREGLETADNSLRNLESETSNIEEQMQKIDEALKAVENAIKRADAREDAEISASLQDNLKNKQVEYEKQVEAKRQIASVLGQIATEIGQLESQNNQSKQEVSQLAALGENVSEGLTLIQERQGMLQSLKQRHERLSARLSQTGPMRESETRSECKVPGFTHVGNCRWQNG
jgi:septation ring formation regulator EzrA